MLALALLFMQGNILQLVNVSNMSGKGAVVGGLSSQRRCRLMVGRF